MLGRFSAIRTAKGLCHIGTYGDISCAGVTSADRWFGAGVAARR
jgi:hypothetical protein